MQVGVRLYCVWGGSGVCLRTRFCCLVDGCAPRSSGRDVGNHKVERVFKQVRRKHCMRLSDCEALPYLLIAVVHDFSYSDRLERISRKQHCARARRATVGSADTVTKDQEGVERVGDV